MDKIWLLLLIGMGFKMKLFPWQLKKYKVIKSEIVSDNGKINYGKIDYGKIVNIEDYQSKNKREASNL